MPVATAVVEPVGVSTGDPAGWSDDRLAAEISTLAGHIAAAMCRWLLLVAEFDRREACGAWDCRSCAHWLSWRCGVNLRTAQEQLRVAHALGRLPRVRAHSVGTPSPGPATTSTDWSPTRLRRWWSTSTTA